MTHSKPGSSLSADEVRQRVLTGALALAGRGTVLRGIGFLTNIVLTRIFTPRQFGTLAIGLTVVSFSGLIASASLGVSLLKRAEAPSKAELQSILAAQLLLGTGVAAVIAAAALPFGQAGLVTLIMVFTLPISAVRTSAVVLTEREIQYGPIVASEIAETLVYSVCAVGAAAVGFGVIGVAAAGVVRASVGSAWMLWRVPAGRVLPRLRWSLIRPLIAFGAQFQAASIVDVARDEVLNVGIAAVGGLPVLGIWSLASKLLQIPSILFETLWRISYPAISRLTDAGEDIAGALERSGASLAVLIGIVLVGVAGACRDGIPLLFGGRWASAAPIVTLSAIGLMFGGPISVTTAGFLYSRSDARSVLRGMILGATALIVVALGTIALTGRAWGAGAGMFAGTVVEATVFIRASRAHGLVGIHRRVFLVALAGGLATGVGWLMSTVPSTPLLGTLAGLAAAELTYGVLVTWVDVTAVRHATRLLLRASPIRRDAAAPT